VINLINSSINSKNRNHSIRVGTPKNNDLSSTLLNNIFKKTHLNSASLDLNRININNPINTNSNCKNLGIKNHLEEKNLDFNEINEKNHPMKDLNNKFNSNDLNTINAIFNNNNIINNVNNITNNTININFNNANIKNKTNLSSKQIQPAKSPQRKNDSLKVTGITKINNSKYSSVNTDRKTFTSDKKIISSCERFFSENSNANNVNNLETKNYKSNNFHINSKNSNDLFSLNNILSYNNFNNYNSNNNLNNTIQPEKQEKFSNAEEISCEETKIKRLRRIIKDSLGGSSCGFDLSCIQNLESPIKENSIKIVSSSTLHKNNFKIALKGNNRPITGTNNLEKNPENNSNRYYQDKNATSFFSKSRPGSENRIKNNGHQHLSSAGISTKNFYNKANHNQRDFDVFFKKIDENLNKGYESKSHIAKKNIEDKNIYDKEANNKKNIGTIEFDLEAKSKNVKSVQNNFKNDKEKMMNNYVTLDLFNLKKNKNPTSKRKVETYNSSIAKYENAFKTTKNKEKRIQSDPINSNFSTNSNTNNSNYPKFTLKSNSISKSKISLNSKQYSKK
jgi:hypothetical protein